MLKEVLSLLDPKPGDKMLDATLGCGGHSKEIAKKLGEEGLLVGIDLDPDVLKIAEEDIVGAGYNFIIIEGNFAYIDEYMDKIGVDGFDCIIADLGMSSLQLSSPERGFSFCLEGPLDMRISKKGNLTAHKIVNKFDERRLEEIILKFGEEKMARKIARAIVSYRRRKTIETTTELAKIIEGVVGKRGKIHPATRTFQAIRIFVNRELDNLQMFLEKIPKIVRYGARVVVISFHSLEDRLVKDAMRRWKNEGLGETLKKPLVPSREEVAENPRARSAKLRYFKFK